VWNILTELLQRPDRLVAELEALGSPDSATNAALHTERRHLEQRLVTLPSEAERLVEGYRKRLFDEALVSREMAKIETERQTSTERLQEVQRQLSLHERVEELCTGVVAFAAHAIAATLYDYPKERPHMLRSTDRIQVTQQGTLAKPADLRAMIVAKSNGQPYDAAALAARTAAAVAEAVQAQIDCGIDSVNDGEMSKTTFSDYVCDRLGGLTPTAEPYVSPINLRDQQRFGEYFNRPTGRGVGMRRVIYQAAEPLRYVGQAQVQADIANLRAALAGKTVGEAYLPAVAPGSIDHWLKNSHYRDEEAFLYGIADAMHEEYQAIVDAGFLLQIDDPDLADGWQVHPQMTKDEYRKEAQMRTAVLNHALRGIPADRVRVHVCWGSYHGPHRYDFPLADLIDILLSVHAGSVSIEASNPAHAHEWQVFEDVQWPDGRLLIPGVVGHCSDFVEHPELVAERLATYANLVGRENVVAGTDCGLGTRVGHGKIALAKFEAMAEGARLATTRLWRK